MAVRTPPSSDLEELEARRTDDRGADRGSSSLPEMDRFLIWTVAVVAVIAVGLQLSGGFPESRTVDLAAKFNQFNDWVIANQRTSLTLRQLPRPAPERDPDRVRPAGPGALAA